MIQVTSHAPRWAVTVILLIGAGGPAAGAVLQLSSSGARANESAKICVSLKDGGNRIAGLQTNMTWDNACMSPVAGGSLCVADPAHGKNVQSALQGAPGELKAIVISFSDVNPIPDGPLFCCEFKAVGREGKCPPIKLKQIIGSTSEGVRIDDIRAENNGEFTILGPSEVAPRGRAEDTTGAARTTSDDGCAIGAGHGGSHGMVALMCFAILFVVAARLRRTVRA